MTPPLESTLADILNDPKNEAFAFAALSVNDDEENLMQITAANDLEQNAKLVAVLCYSLENEFGLSSTQAFRKVVAARNDLNDASVVDSE